MTSQEQKIKPQLETIKFLKEHYSYGWLGNIVNRLAIEDVEPKHQRPNITDTFFRTGKYVIRVIRNKDHGREVMDNIVINKLFELGTDDYEDGLDKKILTENGYDSDEDWENAYGTHGYEVYFIDDDGERIGIGSDDKTMYDEGACVQNALIDIHHHLQENPDD